MKANDTYKAYTRAVADVYIYLHQYASVQFSTVKPPLARNRSHLDSDMDLILINKKYRAIYTLERDRMADVADLIAKAEDLYQQTAQAYENTQSKRPLYLPRIFDADGIHSITVQVNKAANSTNASGDDMVAIASFFTKEVDGSVDDALNKLNLPYVIKNDGVVTTYQIKALDLCNRFQCDSLQVRKESGLQYRFSAFGGLEDSVPQALGVLIVQEGIDIFTPQPKKPRKDKMSEDSDNYIDLGIAGIKSIIKVNIYKRFNR